MIWKLFDYSEESGTDVKKYETVGRVGNSLEMKSTRPARQQNRAATSITSWYTFLSAVCVEKKLM